MFPGETKKHHRPYLTQVAKRVISLALQQLLLDEQVLTVQFLQLAQQQPASDWQCLHVQSTAPDLLFFLADLILGVLVHLKVGGNLG